MDTLPAWTTILTQTAPHTYTAPMHLLPSQFEPEQGSSRQYAQLDSSHSTIQDLYMQMQQLMAENNALRTKFHKLDTHYNTLQTAIAHERSEVEQLIAEPPQPEPPQPEPPQPEPPQSQLSPFKVWHQRANSIIGAVHSRSPPCV